MLDLSIVIVNYNNRALLEACLQSVRQNTKNFSAEIIVVDNASHDHSPEMVKSKFPEVTLIENKENLGFTRASNQGLRLAKGNYLMLLNDDTVVKEGAFERMLEFMKNHPEGWACGPKLLNPDGSVQRQGGILGRRFWQAIEPVAVDFVIGACLMVRREVIDKVGLLDENLFFYNDDLDWCLRIRKAGGKIYFLPQAEVIHVGGASTRKIFNRKIVVDGHRGSLYFAKKHYPPLAYNFYRLALGTYLLVLILGLNFRFFLASQDSRQLINHKLSAYKEILGFCLNDIGDILPRVI